MIPSIVNLYKSLLLYGVISLAVGCASQGNLQQTTELPNLLVNSKAFEDCLSHLAEPLANANNPAAYHLGAKYALACLSEAPENAQESVETSVMQVHALAISQLLKSGDLIGAHQQLTAFKQQHPKGDLLLEDGASFVNTVELIIGEASIAESAKGSLLNASTALKSELRRHQYWLVN